MSDPVHEFAHSHAHLSRLALEIGQALRDVPGALPAVMRRRRLAEQLKLFGSELMRHFAREEEGLFPFVRAHIPADAEAVDRLVEGHDLICGAVVRLVHLVDAQGDVAALAAQYARFEAAYARHSEAEAALFEELGSKLDERHREELAAILRGL